MKPRYPIYIPSKGRSDIRMTASLLAGDGVQFYLVVEPQEEEVYAAKFPGVTLLVLPDNDRGLIFARNWIVEHAIGTGAERHWQLDDNIRRIDRRWKGYRVPCDAGLALAITEDFIDRYENVAIAGLNYTMFCPDQLKVPPFVTNCHVYSCTLMLNSIPNRFREPANEDVDMCLQVLASGWCTILLNAFLAQKIGTGLVSGGQTDSAYLGDGRLFMARSLERVWPGVVEVKRRFKRPQHVVNWKRFVTPLKLREGLDLEGAEPDEYGMKIKQVRPVRSRLIRELIEEDEVD